MNRLCQTSVEGGRALGCYEHRIPNTFQYRGNLISSGIEYPTNRPHYFFTMGIPNEVFLRLLSKLPWKTEEMPRFLGVICLLGFTEIARSSIFWVFLPFVKNQIGLSAAGIGFAWLILSSAESWGRPIGGMLVQKFGMGVVGSISGILGIVVLNATTSAVVLWQFYLLAFLWGLALSALLPGFLSFSARVAVVGREGRALAYANFVLAPWVGIGLGASSFLIRRNPNWGVPFIEGALVIATILGIFLSNVREPVTGQTLDLKKLIPLARIIPAAFAQTFAPALLSLIFIKYFYSELKFNEFQLYSVIGLMATIVVVGIGYFGRIADRRDFRIPLVLGTLFLAFTFWGVSMGPSYAQTLGLAALGGLGFAMFSPSWSALLIRLLPEAQRATVWASLMTIEGLGTTLGPIAGAYLWDWKGIATPFKAAALVAMLVVAFYIFLFAKENHENKRKA